MYYNASTAASLEPTNPILMALENLAPGALDIAVLGALALGVTDLLVAVLSSIICGYPAHPMSMELLQGVQRLWHSRRHNGLADLLSGDLLPRLTGTADVVYDAIKKMAEAYEDNGRS